MSRRVLAAAAGVAIMSFVSIAEAAGGQGPQVSTSDAKSKIAPKPWTPPRTPWGHPDLQGVWDYRTITPLERPTALSGKEFLTEAEAGILKGEKIQRQNRNLINPKKGGRRYRPGGVVPYKEFWYDRGRS